MTMLMDPQRIENFVHPHHYGSVCLQQDMQLDSKHEGSEFKPTCLQLNDQFNSSMFSSSSMIVRRRGAESQQTLPNISDLYSQLILSGLENNMACNNPNIRHAVSKYKKFLEHYNNVKKMVGSERSMGVSCKSSNVPNYSTSNVFATPVETSSSPNNVNTNNMNQNLYKDCKLAPFRYEEEGHKDVIRGANAVKIPSIHELTYQLEPLNSSRESSSTDKKRSRAPLVEPRSKKQKQQVGYASTPIPKPMITIQPPSIYASKQQAKLFDSVKGTTCHQCKQKTLDVKTNCKACLNLCLNINGRGTFCGSCLKNRYGEEIEEVLKDASWSCPVCRDICNCSSCRRKAGRFPISITTRDALKKGFSSVHEMLTFAANNKQR